MDLRRILRAVPVLLLLVSLLFVSLALLFLLSTHNSFDCAQSCSICLHLPYLQRLFRQLFGSFAPLLGLLFLILFFAMAAGPLFKDWFSASLVGRKVRMNN